MLQKEGKRKTSGFIILTYTCRALEWLHFRLIFEEMLNVFGFSHLIPDCQNLLFAWKYLDNLASQFYRPSLVFKQFSHANLRDLHQSCLCKRVKRFAKYLDSATAEESTSYGEKDIHVRTMDTSIIQHIELRKALSKGLNHIPLRPTEISVSLATAFDAFAQFISVMGLCELGFPVEDAESWFRQKCLSQLKAASKSNKFGFRYSGRNLLDIAAVRNEIEFLTSHLYCAGLDKASNNPCFICIRHIWQLALKRLSSLDFSPCKENNIWSLNSQVMEETSAAILDILPELQVSFKSLPYLMATYKQHKQKYRWLTKAFQTIYTNLAHLLTISTMLVLEYVKEWAAATVAGYANFLRCDSSIYWLVNSSIEVALNLPQEIHSIFVADITRCYESIPLQGPDNLCDAIAHVIRLGYRQARTHHPRSDPQIWVRIDANGCAAHATWNTSHPTYGNCFSLSESRLIALHSWLMQNCYVGLGDYVWRQVTGIPMGFACSPLWCNIYLLHYEISFIQRLAKLGRGDILQKFKHAYRYIDDLCWVNVERPLEFLSPNQNRDPGNPYWIYPLQVLEIKCEVAQFAQNDPLRGIRAHFMNLEVILDDNLKGGYTTCKFDKRRLLPFGYTQYIQFASNRPIKQAYSIAVSQTVPILYLSSTVTAAASEILILIQAMVKNGFKEQRLHHLIATFLARNQFPGLKFAIQDLMPSIQT